MKNLLIIFFLGLQMAAAAQQPYWQQKVDHTIDVRLDVAAKTLDGFERINYTNNSPDTLRFIWFHLWPNAYKTDRTAFSNQQLENGKTGFYFATREQRGYINRLDFKVGGTTAQTEDHPEHIDIIKLMLPQPLAPGQTAVITTPFHVKLPHNFSRGGFDGNSFQLTQWYPKPAVYDKNGWHPMPYLDQGEFYNEFGDYDVTITLPGNYVVAATGMLQDASETEWLKSRAHYKAPVVPKVATKKGRKPAPKKSVNKDAPDKTLQFRQLQVTDFAWFANRDFIVTQDTCTLPSGRLIQVAAYYTAAEEATWREAVSFAKDAVRFYSNAVGEYPFDVVSVVQGPESFGGGMEYPTITVIAPTTSSKSLDVVIAHEVGHNWFQGILASNERDHPWMDEGINSFYEKRYTAARYDGASAEELLLLQTQVALKKDQPVTTHSETFSELNYGAVAYYKTAQWMQYLQTLYGADSLDHAMQQYFRTWQFKHPQPEDFKNSIAGALPGVATTFGLLESKGMLPGQALQGTKIISPLLRGSLKKYAAHPGKHNLLLSPAAGFNKYDRLMVGALFTNYLLPPSRFQFLAAPLYATGSKEWNGIGQAAYHFFPGAQRLSIGVAGLHFSRGKGLDTNQTAMFERFTKITPSVRYRFAAAPRSTKEKWVEARSFFIREKYFSSFTMATDGLLYADSLQSADRVLHQLTYQARDHRALYPYQYNLQLQKGPGFYRLNVTGNYFFNYAKGGGAGLRFFGAAFGYTTANLQERFAAAVYQPKLLGVTGEEDYTYSNYFLGRSASYARDQSVVSNAGMAAQQIMIRDGGMKLRLDYFDFLQGRSDQWVAAINFNTTLPKGLFPFQLPLKLFLDAGSYAEAWKRDAAGSRFLYVGGLQLSIAKVVHVYAPIFYSRVFRDNLKSLPEQNSFLKKLTFSIDIQNITLRGLTNNQLSF